LFPGIFCFGIPDPEGEVVAGAIQEFIGFCGLGGAINVSELKFLNLLHIEYFYVMIIWKRKAKNSKNVAKKFAPAFLQGQN